jgi:hypothetical protein
VRLSVCSWICPQVYGKSSSSLAFLTADLRWPILRFLETGQSPAANIHLLNAIVNTNLGMLERRITLEKLQLRMPSGAEGAGG